MPIKQTSNFIGHFIGKLTYALLPKDHFGLRVRVLSLNLPRLSKLKLHVFCVCDRCLNRKKSNNLFCIQISESILSVWKIAISKQVMDDRQQFEYESQYT